MFVFSLIKHGGEKTMDRIGPTSGYSSATDSQLFFGSQCWPNNSQSMSQDVSLSSGSQEGSDPKFSNCYQTKPLLFGERGKTRPLGILEKFEEDRRREKENFQSALLAKEHQETKEILQNIQHLVTNAEGNTAVSQAVLESLKRDLNSLQGEISQQIRTLADKVNSNSKTMTEFEESLRKSADTTAELGSSLQSLKTSTESLREEQKREQNMLEEAIKLLNNLVSEQASRVSPPRLTDSTTQTSPVLGQSINSIIQKKQVNVPQEHSCSFRNRKKTQRGQKRLRKKPLALPHTSKFTVPDENSTSFSISYSEQNISAPVCEHSDGKTGTSQESIDQSVFFREKGNKTSGCFFNPVSCWSQDSNSSVMLASVESMLDKLSAESKSETTVKPQGLWQLFDKNFDC